MNFKDKSHSHTVTAAVFFPSKSVQEDLVSFSHDSTQTARLVISEKMPTKILALNKLLIEKDEYKEFFGLGKQNDSLTKRQKKSSENASANVHSAIFTFAEAEFEALKMELLELVRMTSTIKLWLQLNLPRIEDGNNFGVEVQTDTVSTISRIEDTALMTIESWSKFLMLRAKIIGKMHKYRESSSHSHAIEEAYKMTLEALDEKQVHAVWIGWLDLRNSYAITYDMIMKNIDKLINPRSSNVTNMY